MYIVLAVAASATSTSNFLWRSAMALQASELCMSCFERPAGGIAMIKRRLCPTPGTVTIVATIAVATAVHIDIAVAANTLLSGGFCHGAIVMTCLATLFFVYASQRKTRFSCVIKLCDKPF